MTDDMKKYLYQHDPLFRRTVDVLANALTSRQTTVSMITEAAKMAHDKVASRGVRCPFNLNDVVQLFNPAYPQDGELGLINAIYPDLVDHVELQFSNGISIRVSAMDIVRPTE